MTATAFGKYRIVEKIGAGGFGEVYKGLDPMLHRHVAIKTCSSVDGELRRRFFREAEIAANLQHPNIVTIFDFGHEGEMPYLVQEYLSGEDLDHKIKRREPPDVATKLDYLLQIATGLDYAHSREVVHRDVKPANVRVLDDGQVRIMDFGIAKLLTAETQLTQTGMALGTAAYLPPEQIRGEPVDPRADLFSFGVLAYELMTSERPFEGDSLSAMLYAIAHKEPRPVASPECPPRLKTVIETCLAKDPAARYPGFGEVIAELKSLSAMPVAPPPPPPKMAPPGVPPPPPPASETMATAATVATAASASLLPDPDRDKTVVGRARATTAASAAVASREKADRVVRWILVALLASGLLGAAGLGGWWLSRRSGDGAQEARVEHPPPPEPVAPEEPAPPPAREPAEEPASEQPPARPGADAVREPPPPTRTPPAPPPGPVAGPPVAPPPAAPPRVASPPPPRPAPPPPPPPAPSASASAPLVLARPPGLELGLLAPGQRLYTDRAFTYESVPWNLRDLVSLRTANDHKLSGAPLTLEVSRDVEVFVAHDLRIRDKPGWLEGFRNTGLAVTANADDDESKTRVYQVFARDFPAGVVTLGPNAPPGAASRVSMYTVFLRAK